MAGNRWKTPTSGPLALAARVSAAVALYVLAYVGTTEVALCQFGTEKIDIRLFESRMHHAIFKPLVMTEQCLRTDERPGRFFYGQVHNDASLPPPRRAE